MRVFKRKPRRTYICDPAKNRKCDKVGCWLVNKGPCQCTSKRKCAKLDADGNPVEAKDEDLYNEEYLDWCMRQKQEEERAGLLFRAP